MKLPPVLLLAATIFLLPRPAGQAEIAVTIDHNDGPSATGDFRFKTVPGPRQNAAAEAVFTLVDGERDPNGGSLDVLHDGGLPDEADQPDANFFFRGREGGRWQADLGKAIPVAEIDTYSWHPGSRAPQVYKLYASDGAAPGFNARPGRPLDPAHVGWTLLASVDTRTRFAQAGGQYGVKVADAVGVIGRYRYLLFDVAGTGDGEAFASTFYSEIDVIDRDAPANPAPVRSTREKSSYEQKGIRLVFTNDDPTLDPRTRDRLVQTFFAVYPAMAAAFNPAASKSVQISVEKRYHGVAATAGTTIHVNPGWFHQNPEDLDVVTHEGMHVVQQYHQYDPVWLVEGIADYARYKFGVNNKAAGWTLPDYNPKQNYDNSYRVTARFLAWLEARVKPGIVVTLDRAMRTGSYSPLLWQEQTGKSVEQLWQDYGRNPAL